MAVVSVDERARNRSAVKSFAERILVRTFLVQLSAVADGPQVAIDAAGLPELGDPHPDFGSAFADRVSADETDNRKVFIVRVDYVTPTGGTDQPEFNPLDEDPVIIWGTRETNVIVVKDIDGNPIENSAFDPFDPPLEERAFEQEVTINRNEPAFNPDFAEEFQGKLNVAPLEIAGKNVKAEQARLTVFTATSAERNGIEYFRVTYKIEFKTDEIIAGDRNARFWRREVLDQGLNLIDDFGNKKRILDDEQEAIDKPVKLNGVGAILIKREDSVYLIFDTVEFKDFTLLKLPKELF